VTMSTHTVNSIWVKGLGVGVGHASWTSNIPSSNWSGVHDDVHPRGELDLGEGLGVGVGRSL
jgi:hypothetical protein